MRSAAAAGTSVRAKKATVQNPFSMEYSRTSLPPPTPISPDGGEIRVKNSLISGPALSGFGIASGKQEMRSLDVRR
jgi:hypothetical protein